MRLTAKAATDEEAQQILAAEERIVRDVLGPIVFGVDDDTMESVVLSMLAERRWTLGVAESLTGGMIGSRLCDVPGASAVFRGAVVSYATDVKHDLLGVPDGPVVTESAAVAMAHGARRVLGADVGIAATGVAGPDPQEDQPPGTVCMAVAIGDPDDGGTTSSMQVHLPGRRRQVREFTVITLLALLRRRLLETGPGALRVASDLFAAAAEERLARRGPLADRLRPTTLDEVVGQDHLLGPGKPLRALVDADRLSSVILWGPPGTGKTTIARLIAQASSKVFVPLSAVTATVKDIREVAAQAQHRLGDQGQGTILFLDEIHRFTKAQQDALLPSVETGLLVLIGATTENPYFEVNPPLLSRSTLFRLEGLDQDGLRALAERGLVAEAATATDGAVDHLVDRAGADGRHLLTSLEVALALAAARSASEPRPEGPVHLELVDAEGALGASPVRYGRDDHYDVVSAFIKSIRGSDVDAALHWLARMLEAGEDARFIARRLVVSASEDVGMADPFALMVAKAAANAVEFVGLPEARINLAQATVHLALAPKSPPPTQR